MITKTTLNLDIFVNNQIYKAIIKYDPDIKLFRGEFIGIGGGADFYAKDIKGLVHEGKISLKIFFDSNILTITKAIK